MQTEGGGWCVSRKMSLRTGTRGVYNTTESRKVRNDSSSFPQACSRLRAPAPVPRDGREFRVQPDCYRDGTRNSSWELSGKERSGVLVPPCIQVWETLTQGSVCSSVLQALPEPSYPQDALEGSRQWLRGWTRRLYPRGPQNRAWDH